ncbi:cutinase family protein [Nocardia flavorosea]|uniref:PE-PPE domain-containing protein n=1 Tax=Nocardia flavorosea TaxID=53429 RepID=A0A846YRS0_9NOCA|nr:PE-PPE domain-containing protein [Nocardia flavorosea]NKY60371.1 PE-PPE domain-containing protein [Nocardia flavorosea]
MTAGVVWLGPLAFATPAVGAPDCRPVTIGVGGNGQRLVETAGLPNLMSRQLDREATLGRQTVSVDYKSSVWPTGPYTRDESVADGKAILRDTIADYRAACPGGHVKVIGHSLGAEIAGDEAALADEVVVYGDPRTAGGIYDALPGFLPGVSSPGRRENHPNTTSVCHEFDAACDSPNPLGDPVGFVQGVVGALSGWHSYRPGEADEYPAGEETLVQAPTPIPVLPESTPTGLPTEYPAAPIPTWEPGPLPNFYGMPPYEPTPLHEYVPDEVEQYLPAEALAYIPPPLPALVLPPLPDLGIRLP